MMMNQMMCMAMMFGKGDEMMKANLFQLPNPYAAAKAPTEEIDISTVDKKSTSPSNDDNADGKKIAKRKEVGGKEPRPQNMKKILDLKKILEESDDDELNEEVLNDENDEELNEVVFNDEKDDELSKEVVNDEK
jgi:hypothetical protein